MLSISTETDSDSDSLCSAEHQMHKRQLSRSVALLLSLSSLSLSLNLNLNSTQLVGGAPCGGTSKMQKSKLKYEKKMTRKIGLKKKMNEIVLFTEHRVLTIHTHTSKQ